ncbi:DUF2203 domain-containing protein [Paenibacillus flagellatus]|uniref:DUF2203 domain-containing protein n=1 Tax=Paenibacillus flagellatus TaxID=2211139 RepID=A0A2V5KPI2_9BACL|nr:DUF2203 domain-containing protein [Paenibacillus flagellatus]PYI53107.1 DUF2203 domain-containing protein [Paenibacillus flagellatus]
MEKKWFTPEEANALLPTIRQELHALQAIKQQFEERYVHLKQLKELAGKRRTDDDPFFALECELEFMQIEARTIVQSIHRKGAQLKDLDMGLIDFPSILNGEEVLLCWKLGEESITHWHGMNDGFGGRKPLAE